jgi:hypothetical protein
MSLQLCASASAIASAYAFGRTACNDTERWRPASTMQHFLARLSHRGHLWLHAQAGQLLALRALQEGRSWVTDRVQQLQGNR